MAEENTYSVGDYARFVGYTDLQEGMDPLFEPGQLLQVTSVEADGAMICIAINENLQHLAMDGSLYVSGPNAHSDTLYPAEIARADDVAAAEVFGEDDGGVFTFSTANMSAKELTEFLSRSGVDEPDGWKKMSVGDKRAWVDAWVANNAADAAPVEAAAAPEVTAPVEAEADADMAEAQAQMDAALATAGSVDADTEEAVAGSELVPLMTDAPSVRDILAEQDAVAAAKHLIKVENQTHFTLGGVLKHINESGLYKTYGFEGKKGFEEFCATELDLAYRKARYLIDIYEKFRAIGFDEKRLESIGWSKAKELARISQEQLETNIEGLMEFAESHNRGELVSHIRENYEVATRGEQIKMVSFSFKVVEDEGETIRSALETAKTLTASDDPAAAFTYIVNEWANHGTASDLDLDTFVALAVARFGADAIRAKLAETEGAEEVSPEAEMA